MTASRVGECALVFRRTGAGEVDAIDEYSRQLAVALRADGVEARYESGGLASLLAAGDRPAWVVLEYNPFRYGRWGFAPGLLREVMRLRRRTGSSLAIMVHEAWVPMTDWRTTLMGLWQRAQLRVLLRLVDRVMASTEALCTELGRQALHAPVASNIAPVHATPREARARLGLGSRLTITLFGGGHETRAIDYAEAAIAAVAEAHGADRVAVLNLGAGAPAPRVPPSVAVLSPGRLPAAELSLRLHASDLVLLPFTDGVSTRRSTLMAALAHGRPVLGLRGHNTDSLLAQALDALVLTPVGDRPAFVRRAVELSLDPSRLDAIGDAGRELYASLFDWPVLARTVSRALANTASERFNEAAIAA